MDYKRINELKEMKKEFLKEEKDYFTSKEIGYLAHRINPAKIEKITIQIKLPSCTSNTNNYIPLNLVEKYYTKSIYSDNCIVLKTTISEEELNKNKIPLEVKKYYFSKKDILKYLENDIKRYRRVIKNSCSGIEFQMKELQKRLAKYESYLQ